MFASACFRDFGERGFQPCICWLISCRTVSSVVHDQKREVSGRTVANRRKHAEAGESRDVAVDRYNVFFFGKRQALPDRRAKPHRSEHVEIARLVEQSIKSWRWRTNIAKDQAILEDSVVPVGLLDVAQAVSRHMQLLEQRLGMNGHLNLARYFFSDVVPVADDHERRNPIDRDGARW